MNEKTRGLTFIPPSDLTGSTRSQPHPQLDPTDPVSPLGRLCVNSMAGGGGPSVMEKFSLPGENCTAAFCGVANDQSAVEKF